MSRWEDVLDAQQGLWSFWRTDLGHRYAGTFASDQDMKHGAAAPIRLAGPVPAAERAAAQAERLIMAGGGSFAADLHITGTEERNEWGAKRVQTLQEATMFHADPIAVEPDMWTLIEAAQREFQPEPLRETDLITPAGFILLPRPILTKDVWGKTTSYRAIAWMPLVQAKPVPGSPAMELAGELMGWGQEMVGIWLSLYAHADDPDDWAAEQGDFKEMHRRSGFPDLTLAHQTPWQFGRDYATGKPEQFAGMHDNSYYNEHGVDWPAAIESYINTMRTIQATLRLLQQTIAVHRQHRPDRATRRRAARLDYPEKDVTVVYLRRPRDDSYPADREGKTVEWTHRWIVSGHWRNQYYASLGEHRQIWINPFVKGPDDLPLRVREKRAFILQR